MQFLSLDSSLHPAYTILYLSHICWSTHIAMYVRHMAMYVRCIAMCVDVSGVTVPNDVRSGASPLLLGLGCSMLQGTLL